MHLPRYLSLVLLCLISPIRYLFWMCYLLIVQVYYSQLWMHVGLLK